MVLSGFFSLFSLIYDFIHRPLTYRTWQCFSWGYTTTRTLWTIVKQVCCTNNNYNRFHTHTRTRTRTQAQKTLSNKFVQIFSRIFGYQISVKSIDVTKRERIYEFKMCYFHDSSILKLLCRKSAPLNDSVFYWMYCFPHEFQVFL